MRNQIWLWTLVLCGACDTTSKSNEGTELAFNLDFDEDGFSESEGDCNDFDSAIFPGAEEIPADGVDQNCDDFELCYEDDDRDGYGGDLDESPRIQCDGLSESTNNLDCDDNNPNINPDAVEICDGGIDNDCDDLADDNDTNVDASTYINYYIDNDGDGYGVADATTNACLLPDGYAIAPTDCDDTDPDLNPGQPEICDGGIDNDCDGLRDAEDDNLDVTEDGGGAIYFRDFDNDGEGDPNQRISACTPTSGYVLAGTDCDDSSPLLNTADADFDGLTTCPNSDGIADCDDTDSTIGPIDLDGDGYYACVDDCDDDNANINPLDNDGDGLSACDGDCDDTDPTIGPIDLDGDGFSGCFVDCVDEPNDYDGDGAADGLRIYPGAAAAEPYLCTQDADGDGFGDLLTSCFIVMMLDDFSDGWNSGGLEFYINDEFEQFTTLNDGGFDVVPVCLPPGDVDIKIVRGEFPEESNFTLYNNNDLILLNIGNVDSYSDGDIIYSSTLGEFGSDCNDQNYVISPIDNDNDGITACEYDCNDNNAFVGQTDADGDGYISCYNDCNDSPLDLDGDGVADGYNINPGVDEIWYDGVDQNCDYRSDFDQDFDGDPIEGVDFDNDGEINTYWDFDGDGAVDFAGGTDCDDEDPEYNGRDRDEDGYSTCTEDCDDNNPLLFYGSAPNTDLDECYEDSDGDGYGYGYSSLNTPSRDYSFILLDSEGDAWEDALITVHRNGIEEMTLDIFSDGEYSYTEGPYEDWVPTDLIEFYWTEGTDDNDNQFFIVDDNDQLIYSGTSMENLNDGEMFFSFSVGWGLFDCDENNASIHPGATEIPNNGIDENCDGLDSAVIDNDNDGYASTVDCNDSDEDIHPDADETYYDGVDSDCLPFNEDDADGDFQQSNDPAEDSDGILGPDCDDNNEYTFWGSAETSHPDSCMTDEDDDGYASSTEDVCYNIILSDSYGDGWNGGYLLITADGAPISSGLPMFEPNFTNTITPAGAFYTNSSNTSLSLCAPIFSLITLEYISGVYDIENTYSIYDTNGLLVFSDGPTPSSGVVNSFTLTNSSALFDCDDNNASTYPGAAYNDSETMCYTDEDGDGYGPSDCDDFDSSTYPGAAFNESTTVCYTDEDGDGYGPSDCDDNNPTINIGNGCPPQ